MPTDENDPRHRARQELSRATEHITQGLNELNALTEQLKMSLLQSLDPANNTFGSLAADTSEWAIQTLALFSRCGFTSPESSSTADTTAVAAGIDLAFDQQSEAAGPVFFGLPEASMRLPTIPALLGDSSGSSIPGAQLLVRFSGNQLILTLLDLSGVACDTYRGTLFLAKQDGSPHEVKVVAVCKPNLWWI